MPRLDYAICRSCDGHRRDVGTLSRTRLCMDCAERLKGENWRGLTTKSGPEFLRWRRAMAATVGAVLLDDVRAKP